MDIYWVQYVKFPILILLGSVILTILLLTFKWYNKETNNINNGGSTRITNINDGGIINIDHGSGLEWYHRWTFEFTAPSDPLIDSTDPDMYIVNHIYSSGSGTFIADFLLDDEITISFTLDGVTSYTWNNTTCIASFVKLKTSRGEIMAKDVVIGDKMIQLNGYSSQVLKIFKGYTNDLYQYEDVVVTGWHPVKFKNKYIIAKLHPLFTRYIKNNQKDEYEHVIHFQLERFEDDILSGNVVLESWNNLSHGIELIRN